MENNKKMKTYRCPVCGKLLCCGLIVNGIVQIKCKYCKKIKTIIVK